MKSKHSKAPAERVVKDIRRATREQYSAEEKIRIVLEGLRGDDSIAELCRQEGRFQGIYYKWSKDFMEAGKRRLAGDTSCAANSDEVRDLRREARDLKEVVAEQMLENRLLKKSMIGDGGDEELDIPLQKSSRSSGSLSAHIYLPSKPWTGWALPGQLFTAGMICINGSVRMR